jgi:hypothetical protein
MSDEAMIVDKTGSIFLQDILLKPRIMKMTKPWRCNNALRNIWRATDYKAR